MNVFFSNIKETRTPVIVGIDEAGRGPVVGPLVYGMYVCDPTLVTRFKDSKLLTPKQREHFFDDLLADPNVAGYAFKKIHPVYITTNMEGKTLNLNQISREAVLDLLNELRNKCPNVEGVYIDGLGNNKEYQIFLEKHFNYRFVIENKADSKYQVVSGASIVAKVTRDADIKNLNCGSGYPSDPITKKWLETNKPGFSGYPEYVRHSWQTVKNIWGEKKSYRLSNTLDDFYIGPD